MTRDMPTRLVTVTKDVTYRKRIDQKNLIMSSKVSYSLSDTHGVKSHRRFLVSHCIVTFGWLPPFCLMYLRKRRILWQRRAHIKNEWWIRLWSLLKKSVQPSEPRVCSRAFIHWLRLAVLGVISWSFFGIASWQKLILHGGTFVPVLSSGVDSPSDHRNVSSFGLGPLYLLVFPGSA